MQTPESPYQKLLKSIAHRSFPEHLQHCLSDTTFEIASNDSFRNASPFPHIVIDNFLTDQFCEQLLDEFPAYHPEHAMDENGAIGTKATHDDVCSIGPQYQVLDDLIQSSAFLNTMSAITGIPDLLYDPDYLGGGTHENTNGASLGFHVDFNYHPRLRLHRRINLILFMNREWEESWGGYLELREDPGIPGEIKIKPLFNRAVIFETNEISWHGFPEITLPEGSVHSRKSIALYFYTKERLEEEDPLPRSTIYIEDDIPPHITEGHTLDAKDIATLRSLIHRRDLHIARQYEYERNLISQVYDLKGKINKTAPEQERKLAETMRDKLSRKDKGSKVGNKPDLPYLQFSRAAIRQHLIEGWSETETGMVWSTGPSSLVELALTTSTPLTLNIECQPFTWPDAPQQTIDVYLNEALQGQLKLSTGKHIYRLSLQQDNILAGSNSLRFEYGYVKQPCELGDSEDTRELGVAWFNLWLSGE